MVGGANTPEMAMTTIETPEIWTNSQGETREVQVRDGRHYCRLLGPTWDGVPEPVGGWPWYVMEAADLVEWSNRGW